jgi:hypothetical protein
MKKILLTTLAVGALAVSSFAQGTINFTLSAGVNTVKVNGVAANSAAGARVEMLWAPAGTTDLGLFQVLGGLANVGTPVAGYFSGGVRTVPGIAPGGVIAMYVRGFTIGSGASYDLATARGITPIFAFDTADPTALPAPEAPSNINAAFPGLNIIVPEPSSMALAGLGAASLLIFRRRK